MNSIEILKHYWGYDHFRPLQMEIIQAVLDRHDTLALMPTGGGKSICFQVPALVNPGICLVITPLIALMKDQVENLKNRNIEAVAIYSGMGKRELDIVLDNCIYGKVKFLYLSPERLSNELVQERIRYMNVNLFAVDESHCISQWGYDFRPAYLNISILRELHPLVPFLALTATATTDVVQDIQEKLEFKNNLVLRKSFFRKNLAYIVLKEENKQDRMLNIIQKVGGTGIVYVRNRGACQETARILLSEGVSADFYHAGLTAEQRNQKQNDWMVGKTQVIVATNAFGMGIDKSDVRFVIHLEPPNSLEAYYQEAGRAGRDEQKAYAVMLYQDSDISQLKTQAELSFPTVDFIIKVYQYLGNYFQLAYGAGEGLTVDFDIAAFCQRYQLKPTLVINTLKFLERDGWVALSESVYAPSRLKFEISSSELYKFQVENPKYDGFIKTILRSYGGVFDHYVVVREQDLSRRTGLPYSVVVEQLQFLNRNGILEYLEKTDSPQITYLRPRMDASHLYVDAAFIRLRKRNHEEKLKAVFDYLQTERCRSQLLLSYFDEVESSSCGVCDYCLSSNNAHKAAEKEILAEIQVVLKQDSVALRQLVDQLSLGTTKQRLDLIRKSLDSGILEEKEGLISLVSK